MPRQRSLLLALLLSVLVVEVARAEPTDRASRFLSLGLGAGAGGFNPYQGPTAALKFDLTPWPSAFAPYIGGFAAAQFGGEYARGLADAHLGLRAIVDAGVFGRPELKIAVGGGLADGRPALAAHAGVTYPLFSMGPVGVDATLQANAAVSGSGYFVSGVFLLGLAL